MKLIYLETSVFSFYYDERPSPAITARRQWTEEWWNQYRSNYSTVISVAVLNELKRGNLPHKDRALSLARTLPVLPLDQALNEIMEVYFHHHLMPKDPLGDALHLAFASFYRCEVLLTWNCKHLANANKMTHLRRINTLLGLPVPLLITPLELME